MNNNSDKVKKNHRFNIIDVILILAAIAVVIFLAKFFIGGGNNIAGNRANMRKISYVVRIDNVSKDFHGLINEGDSVCDDYTGTVIGTVSAVTYVNSSYSSYYDSAGYYKAFTYPDKEDVNVTVVSDCTLDGARYTISKEVISAGKELLFRVPSFTGKGICTSVNEVSEEIIPPDMNAAEPSSSAKPD